MSTQPLSQTVPMQRVDSSLSAFGRQHAELLKMLADAAMPENEKLKVLVKLPDLNEQRQQELMVFLGGKTGKKGGKVAEESDRGNPCRKARIDVLAEIALDHRKHGDSLDSAGFPSPRGLIRFVDRRVIGQMRAKEDLAVAVYYHKLALRDPGRSRMARTFAGPVMAIGTTGVGKTFLLQNFAEAADLPMLSIDCSSLVAEGIVGETLSSSLLGHLESHGGKPEQVRGTLVFLDEADKLFNKAGPYGESVGSQLLCLLEGREVPLHRKGEVCATSLKTDTFLVTMAGAFQTLHEGVERQRRTMGFCPDLAMEKTANRVTVEDLASLGVPRELLGRCRAVTRFSPLGVDDLLAILRLDHEGSPLRAVERLLGGGPLELSDKDLRTLAEDAAASGMGARGLVQQVRELVRDRLLQGCVG
jgi:ATP-dependent protease Clp ATPase subunit